MDEFSWAQPYPELQKICRLFNKTELIAPLKWRYCPLEGFLQKGPQCGLVALAILRKNPTLSSVQEILDFARKMQFTRNGEIFSVQFMYELAKEFLKNRSLKIYENRLDNDEIKRFLLDGGQILVPYDTAKDNSPGCFFGQKAHWCVICGCIQTLEDFYVISRHGKVKNIAIWKLNDLAQSNGQLLEFSVQGKLEKMEFRFPEGGINGSLGLNEKCLLIS